MEDTMIEVIRNLLKYSFKDVRFDELTQEEKIIIQTPAMFKKLCEFARVDK